jgi:hypothetical protein
MLAVLLMAGCATKRRVSQSGVSSQAETSAWHTCLIQGARATVTMNGTPISASVTMQTVRDSMIVISVMPFGLELVRFEATPLEVTGINKLDATYATATFAEINRHLVPSVNWDVLQQVCTAELPTGSEKAHMQYTLGNQTIELQLTYPARKLDVPVRVTHQNVSRYKKIDISKWL